MYIPPFTVSAEAINLIAEISAQIERYAIRLEQEDGLRLRKANRIKTIHSSLAIEGNTLSEDEVRDIIDGNGRTGRLWQSLILGKLHPLFEHLPVENMVYSNQQQYYEAITASSKAGQSGPFIDFMLGEIYKTLKAHQGAPLHGKLHDKLHDKFPEMPQKAIAVLEVIHAHRGFNAAEIGEQVGLSERQVKTYITQLKEVGLIVRVGSNKTGHWEVVRKEEGV